MQERGRREGVQEVQSVAGSKFAWPGLEEGMVERRVVEENGHEGIPTLGGRRGWRFRTCVGGSWLSERRFRGWHSISACLIITRAGSTRIRWRVPTEAGAAGGA